MLPRKNAGFFDWCWLWLVGWLVGWLINILSLGKKLGEKTKGGSWWVFRCRLFLLVIDSKLEVFLMLYIGFEVDLSTKKQNCRYGCFKKKGGTPKSPILIGFSIINHPFWDAPIFLETPMCFSIPPDCPLCPPSASALPVQARNCRANGQSSGSPLRPTWRFLSWRHVANLDDYNWVVATQIFFILIPIWGRFPLWLIFFKWVETTN